MIIAVLFYNSAESAFSSLETSSLHLLNQSGSSGANSHWIGSSPRSLLTELSLLRAELDIAVDTAEKCEGEVSHCTVQTISTFKFI